MVVSEIHQVLKRLLAYNFGLNPALDFTAHLAQVYLEMAIRVPIWCPWRVETAPSSTQTVCGICFCSISLSYSHTANDLMEESESRETTTRMSAGLNSSSNF